MLRLVLFAVVVPGSTSCALGDWIVSRGETIQIWLDQCSGPPFQMILAYRQEGGIDPATMIGDDLWFNGPGTFNVSVDDPQFPAFLQHATNGQKDLIAMTWLDQHGGEWLLGGLPEGLLLGSYPDLAPLQISHARVNVEQMYPGLGGCMVIMHMEFYGTPEPSCILLMAATIAVLTMQRVRLHSPARKISG